jgi:hypothetical protein
MYAAELFRTSRPARQPTHWGRPLSRRLAAAGTPLPWGSGCTKADSIAEITQ